MKKIITSTILIFLITVSLLAAQKTQTFKVNSVVSVYDGDTFRANMNCTLGFFCDNMSIRVYGVDTPEKRGGTGTAREKELAYKAQELTEKFLIEGMNSKGIILKDCFKGKYFRLVCKVRNGNGESLSNYLIKRGLGVEYYGGTKTKDWSK